jgi:hypothetical protein
MENDLHFLNHLFPILRTEGAPGVEIQWCKIATTIESYTLITLVTYEGRFEKLFSNSLQKATEMVSLSRMINYQPVMVQFLKTLGKPCPDVNSAQYKKFACKYIMLEKVEALYVIDEMTSSSPIGGRVCVGLDSAWACEMHVFMSQNHPSIYLYDLSTSTWYQLNDTYVWDRMDDEGPPNPIFFSCWSGVGVTVNTEQGKQAMYNVLKKR